MPFNKSKFQLLLIALLFNGCAYFNNDSKKDAEVMSPLPKIKNQFQSTIAWKHLVSRKNSSNSYSNLRPVWKDDRIFAAHYCGIVKALDVNSGKEIWSTNLSIKTSFFLQNCSAKLFSGPTVVRNKVYIGSELAKIYALNAYNGELIWENKVAGEALSTPIVSNGLVLIHTSNGILQALDETDGRIKWTVSLGNVPQLTLRGESTPTVAAGIILVGSDNGCVNAVIIDRGQLIWQQCISQSNFTIGIANIRDVKTTPVVANEVVYALAYNGNLAALDLYSGQIIWSKEVGSITNLLIDGELIYLVDQNDQIIAVNIHDGITIWRQSDLIHRNLTSPIIYNNYLITGDSEGYLHWINIHDGLFISQQMVDGAGFLVPPIVAGNKLIAQAKNGTIYSIIK